MTEEHDSSAEALFAEFLVQRDGGLDFEAFCARHADYARALRRRILFMVAICLWPLAVRVTAQEGTSFPSSGVNLMSQVTPWDFSPSLARGAKCWGYTSPTGREYALFGTYRGTGFVDVTDPGRPVIVDVIEGPETGWRTMKDYGHYVYVVSERGPGIQVIDVELIDSGVVTMINEVDSGGVPTTHNVALDKTSGFLYRVGHDDVPGLRFYDLVDPTNPEYVGCWDETSHDAQVVTYESGSFSGRQIAFVATNEPDSLSIVDVTDKANPEQLAEVVYPNANRSHQVWLSEDLKWAFLNDEGDQQVVHGLPSTIYVFDVSDINNASYVTSFTNGNPAITHDCFVSGDLLFCANRTSGLRVFDVADPLAAFETAWFDNWPADDLPNSNGLKSTYPFFESGIVIGTGSTQGLFMWTLGDPVLTFDFAVGVPDLLDPSGDTVLVEVHEDVSGALQGGSATLHYDAGTGPQSVPLVPVGGGMHEATLPALTEGALVSIFLSAQSTDGFTWTDPPASHTRSERYYAMAGTCRVSTFVDDFESDLGWTTDAQNPDTGFWQRVDPIGTPFAPGDDHTPGAGTRCWVTDNGEPDDGYFDNDVSGGPYTLNSPVLDLSGTTDPYIGYQRWFANQGNTFHIDDVFTVDVTADGASWTMVESVGPIGPGSTGGWFPHQFRVLDFVVPSSTVQVRFVAADFPNNSGVEAAVDDFEVFELGPSTDPYCSTSPNSTGPGALIGNVGSTSITANDFRLFASAGPPEEFSLFFYGPAQTEVPFGNGLRCVAPDGLGLFRLQPPQIIGPLGNVSRLMDYTDPPEFAGQITAGSTWYFQLWYRDPDAGGAFFNLSDGLRASFCP